MVAKKGLQDREREAGSRWHQGHRVRGPAAPARPRSGGRRSRGAPRPSTPRRSSPAAGYVDAGDADDLAAAYRFLRQVEHRLQLVDEQQVHAVPRDRDAREAIARGLGYRDAPQGGASTRFEQDLRAQQLTVRLIHERLYFRPLLEAFAGVEGALTPDAAVTRLEAFGFTDAKRTQAAVRELTRGLNRSSRLMQQLLPLLLDWLSQSPDPDLGLLLLRNLLGRRAGNRPLAEVFRESPEVARRLCLVLGTSRLLGDLLARNPDVIPRLAEEERLRTQSARRARGERRHRGGLAPRRR
ncbi:MAG: hypothetical protein U5R31_17370 [Acidimicrobiia bacterium]|nr:hypothetical protein [Acidimicrobiia bacterium]